MSNLSDMFTEKKRLLVNLSNSKRLGYKTLTNSYSNDSIDCDGCNSHKTLMNCKYFKHDSFKFQFKIAIERKKENF